MPPQEQSKFPFFSIGGVDKKIEDMGKCETKERSNLDVFVVLTFLMNLIFSSTHALCYYVMITEDMLLGVDLTDMITGMTKNWGILFNHLQVK